VVAERELLHDGFDVVSKGRDFFLFKRRNNIVRLGINRSRPSTPASTLSWRI
jgi:hypothetical protein